MTTEFNEADAIRTVFSNQTGEKLIEHWKETYNNRVSFHPENTSETTAFNEGVRSFILSIIFSLEDRK